MKLSTNMRQVLAAAALGAAVAVGAVTWYESLIDDDATIERALALKAEAATAKRPAPVSQPAPRLGG